MFFIGEEVMETAWGAKNFVDNIFWQFMFFFVVSREENASESQNEWYREIFVSLVSGVEYEWMNEWMNERFYWYKNRLVHKG